MEQKGIVGRKAKMIQERVPRDNNQGRGGPDAGGKIGEKVKSARYGRVLKPFAIKSLHEESRGGWKGGRKGEKAKNHGGEDGDVCCCGKRSGKGWTKGCKKKDQSCPKVDAPPTRNLTGGSA